MRGSRACELPHMYAIFNDRGWGGEVNARCGPTVKDDWKELRSVNSYAPILALGALGAGFAIFSVVMATLIGPKRYNRAKLEAYECGIEPTPTPAGGGRFPIKYYLTAMLFIVFDIEIVFLYPWAVTFDALGIFGLVEMLLFVLTVFVAYAYVWRRGGLEWD